MEGQNKKLRNFFNPQSVAVVGATDNLGKVGTVITKNILQLGYAGEVFLVNPNRRELFGKTCYATLADIEMPVDLAIVVVPAETAVSIIENAPASIKNFVVISAGFAETDEEGKKREERLQKIARTKNLIILGPNCLGFINPFIRLNATFSGGLPMRGKIALVSQSGALAVALMDIFQTEKLGFSGVYSIGNKMQLDEIDLARYLADDKNTKVIGVYLEGVKDGSRFQSVMDQVAKKKIVVILKAGKTEKSQKAIGSHTGSLAGSDKIAQAVFEKCGVIGAQDSEQFLDLLKICAQAKEPENEKVAVITNAGGVGVLSADAFLEKKIKLAEFSDSFKKELKKILPPETSVENPIDLLGDAGYERYQQALDMADREDIGSIICVLTPQQQTPTEEIARIIVEFSQKTQKTILACFVGGGKIEKAVDILRAGNIVNFTFAERAIAALDKLYWRRARRNKTITDGTVINSERRRKAKEIIERAIARGQKNLRYQETKKIFDIYGINAVGYRTDDSLVGVQFPAVAKIDSDKILHKTDQEGVILGIKNQSELGRAIERLKTYFPGEEIIVQPQLAGGLEIILGVKIDEIFGPVILYGLGGIYTEFFGLSSILVPPLSRAEIEKSLKNGALSFIFREVRGQKPYDSEKMANIIYNLSWLARENPEIRELDINPLFLYNDLRQSIAVDAKVMLYREKNR